MNIRIFFALVIALGLTSVVANGQAPDQNSVVVSPSPSSSGELKPETHPSSLGSVPAPQEQSVQRMVKRKYDPQRNCVDLSDASIELESGRRPAGPPIILDSVFLPTGGWINVGIDTPFAAGVRYFGYVYRDKAHRLLLYRSRVSARRASESDTLVQKGLLEKDQTIVSLRISDSIAGFWRSADLYLYTCGTNGSPAQVSRARVRLSSYSYSNIIAVAVGALAYLIAAFAFRKGSFGWRSLNPVKITAGMDGRGSLSKFQILFFSLIVFSLIVLALLRTGMLTELSSTILLLMGITGLGSTVAKGADAQRNTLSLDNKAWLLRKGWIPSVRTINSDNAVWQDFFTTNGEFDVYRYQSFIFSLVVGGALVLGGITQISSFSIPETLLGVLGLSQAVYIAGKVVTPASMADLNKALDDLRESERQFRVAAAAVGATANLQAAIGVIGQAPYDAYRDKARNVAALFMEQTGIGVAETGYEPSLV